MDFVLHSIDGIARRCVSLCFSVRCSMWQYVAVWCSVLQWIDGESEHIARLFCKRALAPLLLFGSHSLSLSLSHTHTHTH